MDNVFVGMLHEILLIALYAVEIVDKISENIT